MTKTQSKKTRSKRAKKSAKNALLSEDARLTALAAKLDEHGPSALWHRKLALTAEDAQEGVNKQLDALTLAAEVTVRMLKRNVDHTDRLITLHEHMFKLTSGTVDELKEMAKRLKEFDARMGEAKHSKKWNLNIDKMMARLMVLTRLVQTIQAIFGDGHKHLPPPEP